MTNLLKWDYDTLGMKGLTDAEMERAIEPHDQDENARWHLGDVLKVRVEDEYGYHGDYIYAKHYNGMCFVVESAFASCDAWCDATADWTEDKRQACIELTNATSVLVMTPLEYVAWVTVRKHENTSPTHYHLTDEQASELLSIVV